MEVTVRHEELLQYAKELQGIISSVEERFNKLERAFTELTSPEVFNNSRIEEIRELDNANFSMIKKIIEDAKAVANEVAKKAEEYRLWEESFNINDGR